MPNLLQRQQTLRWPIRLALGQAVLNFWAMGLVWGAFFRKRRSKTCDIPAQPTGDFQEMNWIIAFAKQQGIGMRQTFLAAPHR